jgi:hypothetical protein
VADPAQLLPGTLTAAGRKGLREETDRPGFPARPNARMFTTSGEFLDLGSSGRITEYSAVTCE